MARIPDAEIERLKKEISLVRLVEAQGLKLTPHGKDLKTHCPWHADEGPSLIITPHKNLWHCMGACNTGGSVIDWVMKVNGISFRHAVELLRAEHPYAVAVPPERTNKPVKQGTIRKLSPPVELSADEQTLLNQVIGYYHETLKQSPEALAYLQKRGLTDLNVIDTFKLGFANRTLGLRLPAANRQAGAEVREKLQKLGILRDSGHEHFNGSLVIPVIDDGDNVQEIYGRKITPNLRSGTPDHLYLPGPHAGVFNVQAVMQGEEIILCEALIDALTFWCAGYRNVTTSYGTGGFTDEHFQTFSRFGTLRVLIAYDNDEAGNSAAAKLAERLIAAGMACYRLNFPKGMDANEYALKVTPAAQSLGIVIRSAEIMGGVSSTPAKNEKPAPEAAPAQAVAVPPVASPEPPPPGRLGVPINCETTDNEVTIRFSDRRYRVRGLEKNLSYDLMKVNVLASRGDGSHNAFFVDTLDLYNARHRQNFIQQAATELGSGIDTLKKDLGRVLLKLEELQHAKIRALAEPAASAAHKLSDSDQQDALDLLRDPNLLQRILADFNAAGVVGEETNKLVGYLSATSRLLEQPLAVIIQSTSAAGKSSLMEAVLSLMPSDAQVKYSAMTGQSLFYMGDSNLKHKILAIVEEEGAERASYALKLLQSEGELTIASTGKDAQTGRMVTHEYHVEGPVMIFLTTTALDIDEELLNRCMVLTVDENREQTRAIHALQREAQTIEGLLRQQDRQRIRRIHQNAQRLLRPLKVANPYARQLTFIDDRTRTRRDHMKYLTLIRAIALLHQYQRPVKSVAQGGQALEYIEVTASDIEVANKLAHGVLGRSLDELPPQTRRVLRAIVGMVDQVCKDNGMERRQYRFTRREVRQHTSQSDTQLKLHLARLVDLEYLRIERADYGRFDYELIYDGQADAEQHFSGLIDVSLLTADGTTESRSGVNSTQSGSGRPLVGVVLGGGRSEKQPEELGQEGVSGQLPLLDAKMHKRPQPAEPVTSYAQPLHVSSFLAAAK